jgi:hypothetical protein
MLNLTNGQLPTTWEEAIEAGTRAPSASARNRPPQRRPFAVTGLHIEFLNLIKSIGGTAIENGQAALAGPEGEEVARFLSDRVSTDLGFGWERQASGSPTSRTRQRLEVGLPFANYSRLEFHLRMPLRPFGLASRLSLAEPDITFQETHQFRE